MIKIKNSLKSIILATVIQFDELGDKLVAYDK
jgi:hypothetical protein